MKYIYIAFKSALIFILSIIGTLFLSIHLHEVPVQLTSFKKKSSEFKLLKDNSATDQICRFDFLLKMQGFESSYYICIALDIYNVNPTFFNCKALYINNINLYFCMALYVCNINFTM